jgi:hypothetical protein
MKELITDKVANVIANPTNIGGDKMSNTEVRTTIFFAGGLFLLLSGLVGRGVMGVAMTNANCDSTSHGLAWVLWSPLLFLGLSLIILAGTSP